MMTYSAALARFTRVSLIASLRSASALLLGWVAVARSRRSLARLDDHLLCDIGRTRAEALAEASRLGWDAPSHWKG